MRLYWIYKANAIVSYVIPLYNDNEPDEVENANQNNFAELTLIIVFRLEKHEMWRAITICKF